MTDNNGNNNYISNNSNNSNSNNNNNSNNSNNSNSNNNKILIEWLTNYRYHHRNDNKDDLWSSPSRFNNNN